MKGSAEAVGTNASAPTAQFQSLRVLLSTVAYRKWDFRVTDGSTAFLKSNPTGGGVDVSASLFSESDSHSRGNVDKPT